MVRAHGLALCIFLGPLGTLATAAELDPGANAALKYWLAFAELPRITAPEEQKLCAECLATPLNESARKLVNKANYALWMMRLAAAERHCDWGFPYAEGISLYLPQASAARTLAALACLSARTHFEAGQNAEAIEDIIGGMTLGRQVTQGGVNMLVLTGYAIEHRMIEVLALNLPRLQPNEIEALKKRIADLPPAETLSEALRVEEKWALDWFIRKVKGARDKEALRAFLSQVWSEAQSQASAEKARTFLEDCGGTVQGVLERAEQARAIYERMAKKLELPLDQFEKALKNEETTIAANPVSRAIFPAIGQCRLAQARLDLRRAMLAAAFAIQIQGSDALKDHPDPVVGGSFEYQVVNGGFQLRSRFKSPGPSAKSVTLTVGRPGD
jgi:hypothetical protein